MAQFSQLFGVGGSNAHPAAAASQQPPTGPGAKGGLHQGKEESEEGNNNKDGKRKNVSQKEERGTDASSEPAPKEEVRYIAQKAVMCF